MKHIDLHDRYIQERTAIGDIVNEYIPSKSNQADIFTKALPKDQFIALRTKIGIDRSPKWPSHLGGQLKQPFTQISLTIDL